MTTDHVRNPGGTPDTAGAGAQPRLRRNLGLWQVLGVSLGVMGLSLSANINPQGAEPSVGRAIPLAFLISTIAVLLLSHSFVRLSQHFNTAGSVFGFVGATLGPRAGAVAGWCLLGCYLILGAASGYAAAVFFNSLLRSLGVAQPPQWLPYVITLVILAIATGATIFPARRGTDLLLIFNTATVALILVISVVVLVKLISHGGPGPHFTMSVFVPASGVSTSSLFLGTVFGILAFIGFEGASTLGEETTCPRRSIPRAVFGTVLIGGVFYVFTAAVEVMGFGTDQDGLTKFQASSSLFGDLSSTYLASWVGDLVTIGTMISGLAGAIGCVVGSSRMIYSMARSAQRHTTHPLVKVSTRFGTPIGAVGAAFALMALSVIVFGWVVRTPVSNAWVWSGTMGTLIVLVAYLLATVGAARILARSTSVSNWEITVPVATVVILAYTMFRNVVPYPTGAGFWLPIAATAWVGVAVAAVIFLPGMIRRIGEALATE